MDFVSLYLLARLPYIALHTCLNYSIISSVRNTLSNPSTLYFHTPGLLVHFIVLNTTTNIKIPASMGRSSQVSLRRLPIPRPTIFAALGLYILPVALLSCIALFRISPWRFDYVYSRLTTGFVLVFLIQRVLWAWCDLLKIAYLACAKRKSHRVQGASFTYLSCLTWNGLLLGWIIVFYARSTDWDYNSIPTPLSVMLYGAALSDLFCFIHHIVRHNPSPYQGYGTGNFIGLEWPTVNEHGVPSAIRNKVPKMYAGSVAILPFSGWRLVPWWLAGCIGLEVLIIVEPPTSALKKLLLSYRLACALEGALFALYLWAIFVLICSQKQRARAVSRTACCMAIVAQLCILSNSAHLFMARMDRNTDGPVVSQLYPVIAKYCQYVSVLSLLVFALVWNIVEICRWQSSTHERHITVDNPIEALEEGTPGTYEGQTTLDGAAEGLDEGTKPPLGKKKLSYLRRFYRRHLTLNGVQGRSGRDFAVGVAGLTILVITLAMLCISLEKRRANRTAHWVGIVLVSSIIAAFIGLALVKSRNVEHPADQLVRQDSRLVAGMMSTRRESVPATDMFTFEHASGYNTPRNQLRSPTTRSGTATPTKTGDGNRRSSTFAGHRAGTFNERDFALQTEANSSKPAGPTRNPTGLAEGDPPHAERKPTLHTSTTNPAQPVHHTDADPEPPKRKPTVTFALDGERHQAHDHGDSTEWESCESSANPEPPEPSHPRTSPHDRRSKAVTFDGYSEDSSHEKKELFPPRREKYAPIRLNSMENGMKTVRFPRRAPRPSVLSTIESSGGLEMEQQSGLIGDDEEGIELKEF